jgi:predicted nucleic acid-binding protein
LSVLTIAELRRGLVLLEARGATARAQRIGAWLERLQETYEPRIIPITRAVAYAWANLPANRSDIDSLLAATALALGLTVVTRNVSDFAGTGVTVLNPFSV